MRKATDLFSDEVLANRLERLADKFSDEGAESLRDRWDTVEHDGYTHGELRTAFDMVADPDDWRAPIDSIVTERAVALVSSAVVFFTATVPQTRRMGAHEKRARRSPCENPVLVTSPGYRMGPAGP